MLKGTLTYIDEDYGKVSFCVYAKDSFGKLQLQLTNDNISDFTAYQNASKVYDKQVEYHADGTKTHIIAHQDDNPSDIRRLEIERSSKFKTNITNREFCARVSALVRYVQTESKKRYNAELVNPEDYFDKSRTITLDGIGYIKYDMALISELSITSPFVQLTLHPIDENLVESGLFKELKEKDNYGNLLTTTPISHVGFKLSTETLGFEYTPPIVREPANLFGMYETLEEVIEAHPHKNTSWMLSRDYHIVTDENLDEVMEMFMNHDGYIAFDTETTGLNINFKSRMGEADQLVGVVLSLKKGTGYYFPLQHKRIDNLCGGDHWYFMERYMKPLLENKKIICHNAQYDWKVAYIYNINTNVVYDTMIAFGVTKRYEDPTFKYGLSALAHNLLGLDMFDLSDFIIGGSFKDSEITFADLPYDLVKHYAPIDGDMTLTLYEYLTHHRILETYEAQTVFEMEVNFTKAVAYSEFYGYHVNTEKIPEMRDEIIGGMEKHKAKMFELAGQEFNPNSPKQLVEIMYTDMGIEQIGAKPSTNKETLNALADREDANGEPLYPFVMELKKYRDNEGIYKNFLKRLHEFSTEDGFIFPEVQQLGTNTGRSSIKNPNYQGYNDPVKKNIAPRSGYFHFDCDFSQIEYRVLASMAEQESLMAEFEDVDLDYHTYQASRMFNIPYSLVPKSLRQQSKGINFGLPYGMGDSSLGARIFGERNKETERKAGALRRKFFQGQEKIELFFERVRSEGVSNGYTSTKFNRRRYYQRAKFTNSEIRRQAGNHVIQGTAADIYKIACNRMFNRIVDEGWLGKVLLNAFVHDELLMEVHKSINPYYFFKAWREEFQLSIDGFCKLFAGAGVGYNWYDAKAQDLPPQYIQKVIDYYDANPDMEWDEDFDAFLIKLEEGYENYKIERVQEYLVDPVNNGELIKPIIQQLMIEKVSDRIKEIQKDPLAHKLVSEANGVLSEELIPMEGKHEIKSLKDFIAVFVHFYGVDGEVQDIKSADEAPTQQVNTDSGEDEELRPLNLEDDTYTIGDLVEMRGYFQDDYNDVVYFRDVSFTFDGLPTTMVNYLYNQGCFKHEGKYQLALYDPATKSTTVYNAFISVADFQRMVNLYNTINRQAMKFTPLTY